MPFFSLDFGSEESVSAYDMTQLVSLEEQQNTLIDLALDRLEQAIDLATQIDRVDRLSELAQACDDARLFACAAARASVIGHQRLNWKPMDVSE